MSSVRHANDHVVDQRAHEPVQRPLDTVIGGALHQQLIAVLPKGNAARQRL